VGVFCQGQRLAGCTARTRFGMGSVGGIKRTADDKKLSDYVRWERDKGVCQRCLKEYRKPSGALHAAHCFTRRTKATRLEADNLLSLCFGCHQFVDSHAEEGEPVADADR
jgi:hypothetical protein